MSDYRAECPEFTAVELNAMASLGRRGKGYETYANARALYIDETRPVSEGQKRWLWAIKNELREE